MVTVDWAPPTCKDRNSDVITSYSLRHGFAGQELSDIAMVTRENFTISGQDLQPFVEYVAMVAATNRNGTGPFSAPQTAVVIGGKDYPAGLADTDHELPCLVWYALHSHGLL